METNADFARRHVVPQGRSLTVNITGFQALGFTDGKPIDIEVDPSDPRGPTLILHLADGPDARTIRQRQIVHEAKYNLPPGAAKTLEPELPINHSPTYTYVRAFGKIMELKLAMNRHKGDRDGWKEDLPRDLLERVKQELTELLLAVFAGDSEEDVAREAADVANMAMMVADAFIYQKSEGIRSIVDLQPDEWQIAPVHGGILTYKATLDRMADALQGDDVGPPWLVGQQLREIGVALVAYVEGL